MRVNRELKERGRLREESHFDMCNVPMFWIEVEWHGTVFMERGRGNDDGDDDDFLGKEKRRTNIG